jgi:polysaccharide export outer membrane protein
MSTFPSPPPLPLASQPSSTANVNSSPASTPQNSGLGTSGKTPGNGVSVSSSPFTAATLTSMESLDDKTKLEDGDTVSFRVIEDRDDPVQRVVTDTGEVDFPYIGRVKVEGKTCHAVAIEVKKLLEVDYYKQATVIVGLDTIIGDDKTKPKDLAWVMGEVRDVGPQELMKQQPMTVSQLIIRAGGFGDFADQRKVKLMHHEDEENGAGHAADPAKETEVVDVRAVMDGKSTNDPLVKPGDYIIVPKKFFNAE